METYHLEKNRSGGCIVHKVVIIRVQSKSKKSVIYVMFYITVVIFKLREWKVWNVPFENVFIKF